MKTSLVTKGVILLIISIVFSGMGFMVKAEEARQSKPRLIIISAPDLSLIELKQMASDSRWSKFLNQFQVGAMNLRTQDTSLENRYLSMALSYDASGIEVDQHLNEFVGERLRQNHVRRGAWGTSSHILLQDRFGSVDQEFSSIPWLEAIESIQGPVVLMKERNYKADGLEELQQEVKQVLQRMKRGDSLWIFSPQVHEVARKAKSHLAPILVFSQNENEANGWLYSATTRREGLISYKDIAPTILDKFGILLTQDEEGHVEGHILQAGRQKMTIQDEGQYARTLLKFTDRIEMIYQLRPQILYPLVLFEATVLLFGLLLIYWRPNWINQDVVLKLLLMSLLTFPGVLLVMGAFPDLHPRIYVVAMLLLVLWSVIPVLRYPWPNVLFGVSALTVLLILIDGWWGAELMKHSILGYDPMIGARYYGIGNEYMGVLVGATLIAAGRLHTNSLLSEPIRKGLMVAVLGVVLIYLALPQGGANAGGTITAAVAFGCFILFQSRIGQNNHWKLILGMAILLPVVGFFALLLFNRIMPNSAASSHIGQGLSHLLAGDLEWILKIIQRKLAMNWHLIGVSNWGKLLLAGMFVFATNLLMSRFGKGKLWPPKYKYWNPIFTSIAAGALTAFACNDSGLVAAATLIVYAAVPLIWIQAESRKEADHIKASQSA